MKKTNLKTIETTYYNGSQSVEFKGIYEYKTHKIKIHIDIDSYDKQSSATVKVFNTNDLKWNFLDSIPYSQMASVGKKSNGANIVFYQTKVDKHGGGLSTTSYQAIDQDIQTLLTKAKNIL